MPPLVAALLLAQAPPIAVTDSPPPIIAVTPVPSPPIHVLPPPVFGPVPPMAVVVVPPRARQPLQALVSPADYPASALRAGEQGRVGFRLDVGPDGRVHGCTITTSSSSSALDSATCRILRSRARFTPARDNNGLPVPASVADELLWTLPPPAEHG